MTAAIIRAEIARLRLITLTMPKGPERDAFRGRLMALCYSAPMRPMLPAPVATN